MIENGRKTPIRENPLNKNFEKEEFQKLWNSINEIYSYRVSFNSDELIKKSVQEINKSLYVKKLQYVITQGSQNNEITYDKALENDTFSVTRKEQKVLKAAASSVKYDLVGDIARKTSLTRKTVVSILQGLTFDKFEMFRLNPEDFILKVSNEINTQKATMVVEHITYIPTGKKYDASIFTASDEKRDYLKAIACKKGVQDYVFPDGFSTNSVEAQFVKELEVSSAVEVYAKLPRGFKIPTPVGNYAPDWAIAFKKGTAKHIFFVAETKGDLSSLELRGMEKAKVACADFLFNTVKQEDVIYHPTTKFQELFEFVTKD